jgi:hypothetical protein
MNTIKVANDELKKFCNASFGILISSIIFYVTLMGITDIQLVRKHLLTIITSLVIANVARLVLLVFKDYQSQEIKNS